MPTATFRYETIVNVPRIADPALAVRLWYEQVEIGTPDICGIFGCSTGTAVKLKRRAREQMDLDSVQAFNSRAVNIVCAYKSWGLDVKRLEAGLNRPRLRMTEAGA